MINSLDFSDLILKTVNLHYKQLDCQLDVPSAKVGDNQSLKVAKKYVLRILCPVKFLFQEQM